MHFPTLLYVLFPYCFPVVLTFTRHLCYLEILKYIRHHWMSSWIDRTLRPLIDALRSQRLAFPDQSPNPVFPYISILYPHSITYNMPSHNRLLQSSIYFRLYNYIFLKRNCPENWVFDCHIWLCQCIQNDVGSTENQHGGNKSSQVGLRATTNHIIWGFVYYCILLLQNLIEFIS